MKQKKFQKWTMLKKSFRRFQKKVLTNGVQHKREPGWQCRKDTNQYCQLWKWYANQIKYHKVTGEEPGKKLKSCWWSNKFYIQWVSLLCIWRIYLHQIYWNLHHLALNDGDKFKMKEISMRILIILQILRSCWHLKLFRWLAVFMSIKVNRNYFWKQT